MIENWGYLLTDSARQLRRLFDERMRAMGLTGQQARLLLIMEREEGETQSFYANQLDVEPITLCRMVDRMEESGLIERRPDPDDRRARRLYRSARAREMSAMLSEQVDAMLADAAHDLDSEDREVLKNLLYRLSRSLSAVNVRQSANG